MKWLKTVSDFIPIPGYTVIILCFFFPFFLVKCGDTTLMSIKGTDLITGVSRQTMNERMKEHVKKSSPFAAAFGNDIDRLYSDTDNNRSPLSDSRDKKDNENIPPNPPVIVAFLAAIAGIIISLIKSIKKKHTYQVLCSLVGFVSLLVFYLIFQNKMEGFGDNKMGLGLGGGVSITYGFGTAFYLCGGLFLIIMICSLVFPYFLRMRLALRS
ncbi:hypothetical protein [Chryseobacterium pennipullorum]|uniref:Uncharacterized protein n=1 Tax=Chryseobacterium pennipullorum TaxID=2258963 RepID=A0A3D9B6X4_9FLAO|nr:hypothetical protein [Chryseobacterium pennipullorum]REC49410.1 hypothetical protein DRF67_02710 [Chryseobacterium pennipullorum]